MSDLGKVLVTKIKMRNSEKAKKSSKIFENIHNSEGGQHIKVKIRRDVNKIEEDALHPNWVERNKRRFAPKKERLVGIYSYFQTTDQEYKNMSKSKVRIGNNFRLLTDIALFSNL